MVINKEKVYYELMQLLERVFQLPGVKMVKIRDFEICSLADEDLVRKAVEKCYHDVLSDIDMAIYVTLHPDNIRYVKEYLYDINRIGIERKKYMGLLFVEEHLMYRIIMKNGMRYDLGFAIEKDLKALINNIPMRKEIEIKDDGKFWPRWNLEKADAFWFTEIQALAKLYRGDYLIGDHLANMNINETLVAQMIMRDDQYGTNIHRYGHKEILEYLNTGIDNCPFHHKDTTFNMIADKLYFAALAYDTLIYKLNPDYEKRSETFFNIWSEYDYA